MPRIAIPGKQYPPPQSHYPSDKARQSLLGIAIGVSRFSRKVAIGREEDPVGLVRPISSQDNDQRNEFLLITVERARTKWATIMGLVRFLNYKFLLMNGRDELAILERHPKHDMGLIDEFRKCYHQQTVEKREYEIREQLKKLDKLDEILLLLKRRNK